ncbi:SUR7/PalI family-domain-containing protein [Massariosphaeria phaeospora]|uniref:SUR7/PalI family-domain-containing protein n=1 Tax=Massariosphaeria phaeospora TaxID=100035 RepID=A0A7C8MU33_9PLEO|nr:SUR7/PalI family-domain-containing protein [Massariosphaeria phaeospora]
MGKLGRFACIFTPMALTLASLICLGLVFSGQLNKNMALQRDLYFFKADTSEFQANPDQIIDEVKKLPLNENLDNELLKALQDPKKASELKDFYTVGLWNYCEGTIKDGVETVDFCSERKANFWFNPLDVWKLGDAQTGALYPEKMQKGLDAYKKAVKWMVAAYVIALCLTAAEIVVGILAIFSRWGSLVTTVVSTAQTIFIMGAAVSSTAIYTTLQGVFHTVLDPYKIKPSQSTKMLSVVWLAVAFSIASGFFWLASACCCSGRAAAQKKVSVEKTPYTYERVASPYLGHRDAQQGHQLGSMAPSKGHGTSGHAFEPFRHTAV